MPAYRFVIVSSWEHCSGEARARTCVATWIHDICFLLTQFVAFDPVELQHGKRFLPGRNFVGVSTPTSWANARNSPQARRFRSCVAFCLDMQHHLLRTRHAAPFPLALLVVWTAGTAPSKLPGQPCSASPFDRVRADPASKVADMLLNTKDEVIKSKDEAIKRADETMKSKDEAIKRANEAMKSNDEAIKRADETMKSKDDKPTLSPKP